MGNLGKEKLPTTTQKIAHEGKPPFSRLKDKLLDKSKVALTALSVAAVLSFGKASWQGSDAKPVGNISYSTNIASPMDSTKLSSEKMDEVMDVKPLTIIPAKGTNWVGVYEWGPEQFIILKVQPNNGEKIVFTDKTAVESVKLSNGWNYVITDPTWTYAVILSNLSKEKGTHSQAIVESNDGSKPLFPLIYGTYRDILAIATNNGVLIQKGDYGGYKSLTTQLGALTAPSIAVTEDKVSVTQNGKTAEVNLETGEVTMTSKK
ncbi:MAG: hypothetical protein N3E51_05330 [Candidatus Micrarchaeota archaeon]|nr:hypothetical protein [Candidatus Micrarchaeota archaeon]